MPFVDLLGLEDCTPSVPAGPAGQAFLLGVLPWRLAAEGLSGVIGPLHMAAGILESWESTV